MAMRKLLLLGCFLFGWVAIFPRERWFYEAKEVAIAIQQGHFTLLDARSAQEFRSGHLPSSVHAPWEVLAAKPAPNGQLLRDLKKVSQILRSWGVQRNKPVLVIGKAAQGWGEEGRIAWALRSYGKQDSYILDGGIAALQKEGFTLTQTITTSRGDFTAKLNYQYLAQTPEILANLKKPTFLLIDTREAREYHGEVPYGERRGGHLPGAIHLYFKELMDPAGYLLPAEKIEKVLAQKGITKKDFLVPYCTGGVRSAWVTAVLRHYGYPARNYAGSMWEWTALPASQYPVIVP